MKKKHTKQHHSSWLHISYKKKKKEGRVRGREGGCRKRRKKGKKAGGGGRKGRGRKNREEKEISVECPSERGQCQRERESIKPCLWFLKTIIRENKKEDHSRVSSLGDHKNELTGTYHRASKWRCQGGWLCGRRRVRLPTKMQTGKGRVKDRLMSMGHAAR